jgi:steroid delta-isomerase-like uncharacterized protein
MVTEVNKAIVMRFLEEINRGNLGIIDELVAETFHEIPLWYGAAQVPPGRAGVFQDMEQFITALPDMQMTIDDLVAEGDRVVVRFTTRGTHTGPFRGVAPTGKVIQWTEIGTVQIADGQIASFTTLWDQLGFLQQMGVVPGTEILFP